MGALAPVFRVGILCTAVLLAGCVAPDGIQPAETSGERGRGLGPRVVVGLVDDGVNPYHEVFQEPQAVLPSDFVDIRTGLPPVSLSLSAEGSFEERLRRDQAIWKSLVPWRLYWFEGTRVLALSTNEPSSDPLLLDYGHGQATASIVRNVSRDAWVLMVQTPGAVPGEGKESALSAFEKAAAGVDWLADQPWVDVLSLSIGFEGNPPLPVWEQFTRATLHATGKGKPVVIGAANLPTPTLLSGSNGPPWVITVGGAEGSARGIQPQAGLIVDVVADYRRWTAGREPDSYYPRHGTSFSTPVVAGNIAQALLALREQAGYAGGVVEGVLCSCRGRNVTATDLRLALNASATYWSTLDWDPLNYSDDPAELALFGTAPVLPAPWVQMGWGYVGDDTWQTMVSVLQGNPTPEKPEAARAYMGQQQALREAYWSLARDA